jgi:ribonucleoside-diphosphate reductase alpha chain
MPAWGSDFNNKETFEHFGKTLYNYLPSFRGITTYPDGSRGGQPLTPIPYAQAVSQTGVEYEEYSNENACVGGVCGI